MPRKAKAKTEAEATEAKTTEAAPEAKPVRGAKTAAIKQALKTHKNKSPKEIAELLTASGIPTTAGQVSNVKSLIASKRKAKAAPIAEEAAGPVVPRMPCRLLCWSKQRSWCRSWAGCKESRRLNALAQLMD